MNKIKIFLGLFLIAGFMGCSRSLVKSDYDREINFARYKTFDWKAKPENPGYNGLEQYTLSEKRIKKAVEKELKAKGYERQTTGKPDFLIVYQIAVEDKSNATTYGNGNSGNGRSGYGYRGYGRRGYGRRGYGYRGYGYGGYGHGFGHHGFGHHGFGHHGYGYGGYGYGGYGYGGYGYDDYGYEGIIILDIIDAESNELVWRGWYAADVDDGEIDEEKIRKAVKHILEKFPPQ